VQTPAAVIPIFWSGWGVLVVVVAFAGLILGQVLVDAVLGPGYYTSNSWPKLLASLIAAAAVWIVGVRLNSEPGRVLIDKASGQEITLRRRHTLFFVEMQYWAIPIALFGLYYAFSR
jgi:hypothetical protein